MIKASGSPEKEDSEMTAWTGLLASFRPPEWKEEVYAKDLPFAVENESGRVYLVPRDHDAKARLSSISSSLGLKKARGARVELPVETPEERP